MENGIVNHNYSNVEFRFHIDFASTFLLRQSENEVLLSYCCCFLCKMLPFSLKSLSELRKNFSLNTLVSWLFTIVSLERKMKIINFNYILVLTLKNFTFLMMPLIFLSSSCKYKIV